MQKLAEYSLAKNRIAYSFSQAAGSYDEYASLQREVADELITNINNAIQPKRILDLGSGTGYCTEKLKVLFPKAQVVSLDIAEGMLTFAKSRNVINPVCADAENLPFIVESFDLIVSSLTVQWCQNYPQLFAELYRILRNGGELYLSSFGPKTLQELRSAWQQIDDYVHVNNFIEVELLKQILAAEGFSELEFQLNMMIRNYPALRNLTKELKSIGAHNMNLGQAKGLGGRRKISKLKSVFESNSSAGDGIPVTYELYSWALRKNDGR
jgi:malonyl-CoA O-methyltransferase